MPISQRLSRANSISTDENNLVVAKLVAIDVITSELVDQNSGEITEIEQIEWVWEAPTKLGKPTRIHEWTGLNINSEKTWNNGKETSYNKLTTILIQTGLIDAKRIEQTDLEAIDIESLLNCEFQFELEKRSGKRNIKSVKLSTLKLLK